MPAQPTAGAAPGPATCPLQPAPENTPFAQEGKLSDGRKQPRFPLPHGARGGCGGRALIPFPAQHRRDAAPAAPGETSPELPSTASRTSLAGTRWDAFPGVQRRHHWKQSPAFARGKRLSCRPQPPRAERAITRRSSRLRPAERGPLRQPPRLGREGRGRGNCYLPPRLPTGTAAPRGVRSLPGSSAAPAFPRQPLQLGGSRDDAGGQRLHHSCLHLAPELAACVTGTPGQATPPRRAGRGEHRSIPTSSPSAPKDPDVLNRWEI